MHRCVSVGCGVCTNACWHNLTRGAATSATEETCASAGTDRQQTNYGNQKRMRVKIERFMRDAFYALHQNLAGAEISDLSKGFLVCVDRGK